MRAAAAAAAAAAAPQPSAAIDRLARSVLLSRLETQSLLLAIAVTPVTRLPQVGLLWSSSQQGTRLRVDETLCISEEWYEPFVDGEFFAEPMGHSQTLDPIPEPAPQAGVLCPPGRVLTGLASAGEYAANRPYLTKSSARCGSPAGYTVRRAAHGTLTASLSDGFDASVAVGWGCGYSATECAAGTVAVGFRFDRGSGLDNGGPSTELPSDLKPGFGYRDGSLFRAGEESTDFCLHDDSTSLSGRGNTMSVMSLRLVCAEYTKTDPEDFVRMCAQQECSSPLAQPSVVSSMEECTATCEATAGCAAVQVTDSAPDSAGGAEQPSSTVQQVSRAQAELLAAEAETGPPVFLLGGVGQSCDQTCAAMGGSCAEEGAPGTAAEMQAAYASTGESTSTGGATCKYVNERCDRGHTPFVTEVGDCAWCGRCGRTGRGRIAGDRLG